MKLPISSLYIISDAPKYDIISTENIDVIDSFISKILTFKECLRRVKHVLDTLWTLVKRQYLWKKAINQIFCFSLTMSPHVLGASEKN